METHPVGLPELILQAGMKNWEGADLCIIHAPLV